jgi:selenocysteine lyase/cysteine desulfurase
LLEALGIPAEPGALRLSFVHYTSPEDLRQLLAALDSSL